MKTPQVDITRHLERPLKECERSVLFLWCALSLEWVQIFLSSVPDSDATVSSENSEGEGPRERERERDGAKK